MTAVAVVVMDGDGCRNAEDATEDGAVLEMVCNMEVAAEETEVVVKGEKSCAGDARRSGRSAYGTAEMSSRRRGSGRRHSWSTTGS